MTATSRALANGDGYGALRIRERIVKAVDRAARERAKRADLSLGAKLLAAEIERSQRARRGNQVLSVRACAEMIGRSIRTAERYLKELREAGVIHCIARWGARGIRGISRIVMVRKGSQSDHEKPHFNTPSSLSGSTRARGSSSASAESEGACGVTKSARRRRLEAASGACEARMDQTQAMERGLIDPASLLARVIRRRP